MNVNDENYSTQHAIMDARNCAVKTIKFISKETHGSGRALTDVEIDKIKDSTQILMYCKEFEKSCVAK